jgi:hypothetical protein
MALFIVVGRYQRFKGKYCLHIQGTSEKSQESGRLWYKYGEIKQDMGDEFLAHFCDLVLGCPGNHDLETGVFVLTNMHCGRSW